MQTKLVLDSGQVSIVLIPECDSEMQVLRRCAELDLTGPELERQMDAMLSNRSMGIHGAAPYASSREVGSIQSLVVCFKERPNIAGLATHARVPHELVDLVEHIGRFAPEKFKQIADGQNPATVAKEIIGEYAFLKQRLDKKRNNAHEKVDRKFSVKKA